MLSQPLAETHPNLAVEADGWDPRTISKGSDKKLNWKCSQGHGFVSTVANRVKGSGCPYCAGRKALSGFNDMATTHPSLARQADGWDPRQYLAGTATQLSWKCDFGHRWITTGNARVSKESGCPVCSNKKIVAGVNDLATVNPDLATEADGWDPSIVAPKSNAKRPWICPKFTDHRWVESISNRAKGRGCPFCSNHQVKVGFNDLLATYPNVAAEADGWDARAVVPGSHQKRHWKCSKGHTWLASIVSRTSQGSSCPYCAGQRAIKGVNDLGTIRPDIAAQADGWDPSTVMVQANKKFKWVCSFGHTWVASVANRTNGTDCPVCSGNAVLVGFNDLLTTHPAIAAEAYGWDPTIVSKGHITKKSWQCPIGHVYQATVNNRVSGRNCPVCAGKTVLIGSNDLLTTHPQLAMEADHWDPRTVTAGSGAKKSWICPNGHQWKAVVSSRTGGNGCPTCARFGFDPNREGFLYFLRHDHWCMLQVGITNSPEQRLRRHKRLGWDVLEVRGPMSGEVTRGWERSILDALRRRGANLGKASDGVKFDGYTEAWGIESFSVRSLKQLMDLVHEDES